MRKIIAVLAIISAFSASAFASSDSYLFNLSLEFETKANGQELLMSLFPEPIANAYFKGRRDAYREITYVLQVDSGALPSLAQVEPPVFVTPAVAPTPTPTPAPAKVVAVSAPIAKPVPTPTATPKPQTMLGRWMGSW